MACIITTTRPIQEEEEQLANCVLVWRGDAVYARYQKDTLDDLKICSYNEAMDKETTATIKHIKPVTLQQLAFVGNMQSGPSPVDEFPNILQLKEHVQFQVQHLHQYLYFGRFLISHGMHHYDNKSH